MAMESIEIVNELAYTLGSQDNSRRYAFELDLSGEYSPSSIHGVIVDGVPTAVFAASGGATGVHDHSFIRAEDRCYLAVGSHVVCFGVKPFEYLWTLRIDEVTCFGVHYGDEADALVSHGELDISRFTESGQIVWSKSGEDAFTGAVTLRGDHVEAIDFNGRMYRFDYIDGHERN
jgi:hypothetical protein